MATESIMLRNEVRLTIFDNLLDTNDVNDTEHNPVDSRIANDGCADVYGKLKNCYARFLVREKRDFRRTQGKVGGWERDGACREHRKRFGQKPHVLLAVTQFSLL
jgi:hypothetical protein